AAFGLVAGRRLRRLRRPPRHQPHPHHHLTPQPVHDREGGDDMARTPRRNGRDISRLLADFGHALPTHPAPADQVKDPRLFRYAPKRGPRRAGRGWAPAVAPVTAYRMPSDQAAVFWP